MGETEKYARAIQRREGWLCLDFANTAAWHASTEPDEELRSYADLVAWAQSKGILTPTEGNELLWRGDQAPETVAAVLQRAIELRETIYRIFAAVAGEQLPAAPDLAILNEALAGMTAHFQIIQTQEGFTWDWCSGATELDAMLWPVVRSAANLLTSEDLSRVGQCADDRGCGWLFLDTSRNRSRRWCSMDDCGNRAKARLHYQRHRQEDAG